GAAIQVGKAYAIRSTRCRLQRIEALLQGQMQVIARLAEAGIARRDEIALRPAQELDGAATCIVDEAAIGFGDLAIQGAKLRIGADRLLDRQPGRVAVERGVR